ncbi:hypothetical protein AVEN_81877-1 [Araneus ventricosus]|uniref:Uncharacterized protein n=1 Tax=Araneus ventricosus TaxID=182803 RepID=A0A4Y2AXG2_ARAVE|nr:hypothetical protein AVEN_81877-1 [Araneus ventricosus]
MVQDGLSTMHDCWEQWSRESTVSRTPRSSRTWTTTESEDRRIRRMTVYIRNSSFCWHQSDTVTVNKLITCGAGFTRHPIAFCDRLDQTLSDSL